MVSFASGLATIIARPPTPPRESTTKLSNEHLTGFTLNALSLPLLDTPEESPSSSAEFSKGSSGKARKKVGFSPWTEYHRPLSNSGKDSDSESQIRRLPPSKECKSSNKSILKPCSDNSMVSLSNDLQGLGQSSVPVMLRSTSLHLASTSRSSRLDAYSTLLACLSAYDDIPDIQELSERIVEITGYIRRDITIKIAEEGSLDIQLATQALKAITVFVCTPTIAGFLPEDFCLFFLERAISSIEDAQSPKILVSHYMHLLEKQKLGPKQMTTDRVNRLLTALDGITNRVKGNRVVGHRLMIYQRLLLQAKPVMASRVGNWIDHLVGGMLSTIKDIRARAINFGIDAGLQLGTTNSVTQACLEIFNRASPEGKRFVEFFSSRLIEMSQCKEDGVHVPQIWSVVVLFLRSRRRQLECWEHIKTWLGVIQRCFNSSDAQIKFQAKIAWNRLIFAIHPDTSTCESMVRTLRQPIVASLERKDSDKNSRQAKQIARSSYCILLFYAFRPASSPAQLDKYWDIYVSQILTSCFTASKTEANYACDILKALFAGNGKPKLWDENRANVNGPMTPEELPCIESKWVRRKTRSILHIFGKLFDAADWTIGEGQEGQIKLAWRSFMTALGNAGSKEVKVSMDSMIAITHIFNEIKHLLEQDPRRKAAPEKIEQTNCFEKVNFLLREAVDKIGNIPFMERRVILTSHNCFEAAETPSSGSSRDHASLNSLTIHLLSLLITSVEDEQINSSYVDVVKAVMQIPLQSATSRRAQLAALRNMARLISTDTICNTKAGLVFWKHLAEAASLAMRLPQPSDSHNSSPQYPGHEYREVVKLLELGVHHGSTDISVWRGLHDSIADALREEVGNEGVILMITEPLAALIWKQIEKCNDNLFAYAISILNIPHLPQSAHRVEHTQKLLWGVIHATHKVTSVDPFDNVYTMMDALLINAYERVEHLQNRDVEDLLTAATQLLKSCQSALQKSVISRIQRGLAVWIEDAEGLLSNSGSLPSRILPEVKALWQATMTAFQSLPNFSTDTLSDYEVLLLSSLKSRQKSIVNDSLSMWNRTFGCAESLEYPEKLRTLLLKIQHVTELSLPTLPATKGGEVMSSPFNVVESQGSEDDAPQPRLPATKGPSPITKKCMRNFSLSPNPVASAARKLPQSPRRAVKTTPKARLRHDNSQIQFAAIESSPLALEPVDSQALTDRQKEVKERQGNEAAAMFPEIRSSSRSVSRPADYSLPRLVLNSTRKQAGGASVNDDTSPIFPPDVLMNDFLGSSPTPSSSKKGVDHRSDEEALSSPIRPKPQLNVSSETGMALGNGDNGEATAVGDHDYHTTFMTVGSPVTKDSLTADGEREVVKEVSSLLNENSEASAPNAPRVQPEERITSDSDVYVDAPAEPLAEDPANEPDGSEVSRVMNSFQSEQSSHLSAEDDQVAAQLIGEMERASSLQTRALTQTAKPRSRSSRKRKSIFDHAPSAKKKARHATGSPDQQNVTTSPKSGVAVADCVMIDVRQVRGEQVDSPSIKTERSTSPASITATQFEQGPVAGNRNSRRASRTKRVSQLGQEASSVRRSPRQVQVKAEPDVDVQSNSSLYNTPRASNPNKTSMSKDLRPTESTDENMTAAITRAPDNVLGSSSRTRGRRHQHSHGGSRDHDSSLDTRPPTTAAKPTDADMALNEMAVVGSQAATSDNQRVEQVPQHQTGQSSPADRLMDELPSGTEGPFEARGEVVTAQRILQGFRNMLQDIKRVALGPEEERAMVGILFESVKEVHEAGRRSTGK